MQLADLKFQNSCNCAEKLADPIFQGLGLRRRQSCTGSLSTRSLSGGSAVLARLGLGPSPAVMPYRHARGCGPLTGPPYPPAEEPSPAVVLLGF